MATQSKEVVSGVGVRYAVVLPLNSEGLPMPDAASAALSQGTLVQGIKTMSVTDPEIQRIQHYGDDETFAQDTLPAADVGSFAITTAKSNMILDAMVEGNKVRTVNGLNMRAGNTDKKGSSPQLMFAAYRQALDTKKGSSSFGKLRQWNLKIYPSARISTQSQGFEQGATDKTYDATPTKVSSTPWNEVFNEANWGNSNGEFIEITTDYQPRFNYGRGNGTIVAFQLSHPPFSSSHITVWVDGTQTAPSAVDTSATNPAFTLGAAPGVGKQVFVLIETNAPGNS